MKRDREVLENNLINTILRFRNLKRDVADVKKYLAEKHQIIDTQLWLDQPESIKNLDIRELFLLTEQVYLKTGDLSINPDDYFTRSEIQEARQFTALMFKEDTIDLPFTIENVLQISPIEYVTTMDIKTINKLLQSNILFYNFDIQREAKIVKRKDNVIMVPTLNPKSVKEIAQNLLEGKQFPSELKFNAAIGTAESGDELIYDPRKMELTINKGVRLDILDGFHRIKGIENALSINSNLTQKFTVFISNYSTRQAQLAQAQIAKANKFSKQRIQSLEQSSYSDMVINELKNNSELRISQKNYVTANEVVSYSSLREGIEMNFNMKTRLDSLEVSSYLNDFFTYLLGSFPDEFLNKVEETRKYSLINDSNIIGIGYTTLARRMKENNIRLNKIVEIINSIDFKRDNSQWVKIGILKENGNLNETRKVRKIIKEYFENLELKQGVV